MRTARDGEQGMILVNVLMFVAIAAGIVLLLINREELALDRGLRMREAARALAVVRGGELSAIVALRRDAENTGDVDHGREAWAQLAEQDVQIDGGSFSLAIADAQGRLNINMLRFGDLPSMKLFEKIAKEAGLTAEQIVAAIVYVREKGPLADTRPLRTLGLAPEVVSKLDNLLTALPGQSKVNLNAAGRDMMIMLLDQPALVDRLLQVRARRGYLSAEDLLRDNIRMPAVASFNSSHYWVLTSATIGSVTQRGMTLIQRVPAADGRFTANAVGRWRGPTLTHEAFLLR